MDFTTAIILGIVQGITEFLPISSSGHLVLFQDFLNQDSSSSLAITAILHLSTLAAIVIYFRKDIWILLQTAIRKLGRLPVNEKDLIMLYALLFGTIPAVIVGVILETLISEKLQSPLIVVWTLFISSLFFMYAEWRYFTKPHRAVLSSKKGFLIGCFQVLALVPGFSRSGATLAGGMLLGLTRIEAARFSFLLAVPIIAGAGLKKLIDLIMVNGSISWLPIIVGSSVSFVVALFVIHFFLAFIGKHTLWPFIWYKLMLAAVVAFVLFTT